MAKYRKKPVVIDAVQWDGKAETANGFLGERYGSDWKFASGTETGLVVPTLEGEMRADLGDWLIRGVKGEYYPCKPDIFAATYDAVEA